MWKRDCLKDSDRWVHFRNSAQKGQIKKYSEVFYEKGNVEIWIN